MENKYKILKITPELIVEILKPLGIGHTGYIRLIKDGLPPDVELVDVGLNSEVNVSVPYPNTILLKLKSEEFDGIPKGLNLPFVTSPMIQYTKLSEQAEIIEDLLSAIDGVIHEDEDGNVNHRLQPSSVVIDRISTSIKQAQEYLKTIKQSGDIN